MTDTALFNEPRPLREDARFAVRDLLREFEQRKGEILQSASRAPVPRDRGQAGDVADIVGIAKRVGKRLEERQDELTEPYREAATVVRSAVGEFWAEVLFEIDRLTGLIATFEANEKERIRVQELEQQREQEAMRSGTGGGVHSPPAAPPPVQSRPIRGTYGARVGKTKTIEITVVDVLKVPLEILNSAKVHDAIAAVARDFARHQATIEGLTINRGQQTSIRSS